MANFKELEITLKALGNKRRLAIVRFVRTKKEGSVGEIAEDISLSFKSTSRHLSILARAGIFEKEQRGPQVYYFLSSDMPDAARRIIALL